MNNIKNKIILSVPVFIIIALAVALVSGGITYFAVTPAAMLNGLSVQELYSNAITDAMLAEEDEIMPLVAVTPDSPMIQWNESKDKVLLVTWHRYPDSYVPGSDVTLEWGDVWVFSEKEIRSWYEAGNLDDQDEILRLEQLIGLPPKNGYTHFTTLWVSPEDLFRPSCDSDITDTTAALNFGDDADESYVAWFHENTIDSYYPPSYPWTRLGYTYDWAPDDTEYGLSEFVVKAGSQVTVDNTYTNDEFIAFLTGE